MLLIHDRASLAHVLSLDLDPQLSELLERRLAAMVTPYGDLTDVTEFCLISANDLEAEVEAGLGFSPLVEPITGARFGSEGFEPYWDHLVRHDGWFELAISYGSTFASVLLIQDRAGAMSDLRAMCEAFA